MPVIELTGNEYFREDIAPPAEFAVVPEAGFYGKFPNYAGLVANSRGIYPVSWLQLSHPTGHYVSRLGMYIVNMLMRHHSVILVGNTCAPGYFWPSADENKGWDQFGHSPSKSCGTVVLNVKGIPEDDRNRIVFKAEPFMVLNLDPSWHSHTDYLNAMSSKYRIRANSIFKAGENLTLTEYNGNDIPENILIKCGNLLKKTLRDKIIAMPQSPADILKIYCKHFSENIILKTIWKDKELIGFISFVRYQDSAMAMHLGYDSHFARETKIYQRLLHELIRYSIENKIHQINLGRTATEIKSTLGAIPEENSFLIYTRNRFWKFILKFYKKYYYKPEEFTIRNPFK